MTIRRRAEYEARRTIRRYGKLPRKKKKRFKNALKRFIWVNLTSGMWDELDSLIITTSPSTRFMQGTEIVLI